MKRLTVYFLELVCDGTKKTFPSRVISEDVAISSPLICRASIMHLAFLARLMHNADASTVACIITLWSNRSRWLLEQSARLLFLELKELARMIHCFTPKIKKIKRFRMIYSVYG